MDFFVATSALSSYCSCLTDKHFLGYRDSLPYPSNIIALYVFIRVYTKIQVLQLVSTDMEKTIQSLLAGSSNHLSLN